MADAGERVTVGETLEALVACLSTWERDARVVGNVRAGDILDALSAAHAENARMREALVGLVGASDPDELAQMKAIMSAVPHPDSKAILFAIDTLLAALSGQTTTQNHQETHT